jgi:hypothetical protein
MNFQLGNIKKLPNLSSISLKKSTLWKVAKDTIDTKNDEPLSCARLKLKSSNPCLCIKKKNIMHLPKRKRLEQREIKE